MGLINLGGGSLADWSEWSKTPAGKASYAQHVAKYGDQTNSPILRAWQPSENWQRELADYRSSQPSPAPAQQPSAALPSGSQGMDMSVYAPGRAQPAPQPSAGTPYGGAQGGATQYRDGAAYNADGHQVWITKFNPAASPAAPQTTASQPAPQPMAAGPATRPNQFPILLGPGDNPYANMPPGVYGLDGRMVPGNMQQAIGTAISQRDALMQQINANNARYALAGGFGVDIGPPQFDYGNAWQRAQDAVAGGWMNPFTQYFDQATSPPAFLGGFGPQPMYNPYAPSFGGPMPFGPQAPVPQAPNVTAIQDLFARNNIQAPQGFLDQLIGLLGGNAPRPQLPAPPNVPQPRYPILLGPQDTPIAAGPTPQPDRRPAWRPAYGEYDPTAFYNDEGRAFSGTQSFLPGTSREVQDAAYRRFAESQGYFNSDRAGWRVNAAAAQPVQPPSQPVKTAEERAKDTQELQDYNRKMQEAWQRAQAEDQLRKQNAANRGGKPWNHPSWGGSMDHLNPNANKLTYDEFERDYVRSNPRPGSNVPSQPPAWRPDPVARPNWITMEEVLRQQERARNRFF